MRAANKANNRTARRPRMRNFPFGTRSQAKSGESYASQPTGEYGAGAPEEKLASLFEPDTLAAAQYFDTLRRKTVLEPEKRLILAVLEDGIKSLQDNVSATGGKGKKLFEEAEDWVMEQNSDWIFSFTNVCELLGLNPEYVRKGLLRWKQKRLARHSEPSLWEGKRLAG
jgi:hypothetical protein